MNQRMYSINGFNTRLVKGIGILPDVSITYCQHHRNGGVQFVSVQQKNRLLIKCLYPHPGWPVGYSMNFRTSRIRVVQHSVFLLSII